VIEVSVDGRKIEVVEGATLLEALRDAGADVPTLCYDERQAPFGACRVCLVGVAGAPGPLAACTTPCRDGMAIDTRDATARRVATAIVELVLSELAAAPSPHTELARVAALARGDTPGRPRRAPPLPRVPARAVHLVRALRARL